MTLPDKALMASVRSSVCLLVVLVVGVDCLCVFGFRRVDFAMVGVCY